MMEVELRGLLDKNECDKLTSFLENNGKKIGESLRLLIDYTPFKEDKDLDVRLRITGENAEIMIKKGRYLSSARKEIQLRISKRDIPNAIEVLGALGYTKGIVAIRKIYKYVYEEIEFAVSDIAKVNDDLSIMPSQAFFFEAEIMADEEEVGNAKKEISHLLNKLGLNEIDDEKFRDYVLNEVNKKFNLVFDSSIDKNIIGKITIFPD
jgi:adenylate cyclase class IV